MIILTNIEVLDNQLLTVVYVSTNVAGTSVFTDEYVINAAIKSGATGTQVETDRVFYNTDQNKYEFYLSSEPLT